MQVSCDHCLQILLSFVTITFIYCFQYIFSYFLKYVLVARICIALHLKLYQKPSRITFLFVNIIGGYVMLPTVLIVPKSFSDEYLTICQMLQAIWAWEGLFAGVHPR